MKRPALLLSILLVPACGDDVPSECKVTYEFTGSGADEFTATYIDNNRTVIQEPVTVPWTKSYTFENGRYVSLGGNCLAKDTECDMTVTIKKGSYVADTQSLSGGIVSVSAAWEVDCSAD